MAIIMTAATDTTTEPATESAGAKLMMLLKSVVFISVTVPFPVKKSDRRRRIAGGLKPLLLRAVLVGTAQIHLVTA